MAVKSKRRGNEDWIYLAEERGHDSTCCEQSFVLMKLQVI
jgi:hypothetical protein